MDTATPPSEPGAIEIKPQALFSLALEAALSTYGVVGIASRYTGFDVTRREPRRGLDVKTRQADDGVTHVVVSAHIIVEYGVRIQAVVSSLQHQVAYVIERNTGYVVDTVNVHVTALRVTSVD
jgi:uncharacterized alkaline shock family protein YloU